MTTKRSVRKNNRTKKVERIIKQEDRELQEEKDIDQKFKGQIGVIKKDLVCLSGDLKDGFQLFKAWVDYKTNEGKQIVQEKFSTTFSGFTRN